MLYSINNIKKREFIIKERLKGGKKPFNRLKDIPFFRKTSG